MVWLWNIFIPGKELQDWVKIHFSQDKFIPKAYQNICLIWFLGNWCFTQVSQLLRWCWKRPEMGQTISSACVFYFFFILLLFLRLYLNTQTDSYNYVHSYVLCLFGLCYLGFFLLCSLIRLGWVQVQELKEVVQDWSSYRNRWSVSYLVEFIELDTYVNKIKIDRTQAYYLTRLTLKIQFSIVQTTLAVSSSFFLANVIWYSEKRVLFFE